VNAETLAEEASGNYAGVVEDNQFVAGEEVDEVCELRVFQTIGCSLDDEQSRRIATVQGSLGDEARREVVIEVVDAHGE
jgi:hypothetical protein